MSTTKKDTELEIDELAVQLRKSLHQYPNFPKEGILFEDFLPIFRTPSTFNKLIVAFKLHLLETFPDTKIDYIVALESRGFLFGPTLAMALDAGFVPIRKKGKLPGETYQVEYQKEYGSDFFEIQKDALPANATVVVVDDLLATGGSAQAAGKLIESCSAKLLHFLFVMELEFLNGKDKLQTSRFSLLTGQPDSL